MSIHCLESARRRLRPPRWVEIVVEGEAKRFRVVSFTSEEVEAFIKDCRMAYGDVKIIYCKDGTEIHEKEGDGKK